MIRIFRVLLVWTMSSIGALPRPPVSGLICLCCKTSPTNSREGVPRLSLKIWMAMYSMPAISILGIWLLSMEKKLQLHCHSDTTFSIWLFSSLFFGWDHQNKTWKLAGKLHIDIDFIWQQLLQSHIVFWMPELLRPLLFNAKFVDGKGVELYRSTVFAGKNPLWYSVVQEPFLSPAVI